MPLAPGDLAVVKQAGLYRDLDSGEKDYLNARDIVRTLYRRGSAWAVDPGPGASTMLVPSSRLIAFKDPLKAAQNYKPGDIWGAKHNSNPFSESLLTGFGLGTGFAVAGKLIEKVIKNPRRRNVIRRMRVHVTQPELKAAISQLTSSQREKLGRQIEEYIALANPTEKPYNARLLEITIRELGRLQEED